MLRDSQRMSLSSNLEILLDWYYLRVQTLIESKAETV